MYKINCIGLLTSGGDAPGMNAAIRSVTRAAIFNGIRVKAIYRGYRGLITGEIKEFHTEDVSNIIQRGGTIIKTARCTEFTTPEGRKIAYDTMMREEIDALVVIGGDGTFLNTAAAVGDRGIPILGINAGRLGFLADVADTEIEQVLDELLTGNYTVRERCIIQAQTSDQSGLGLPFALNEIAVLKQDLSSLIAIHA